MKKNQVTKKRTTRKRTNRHFEPLLRPGIMESRFQAVDKFLKSRPRKGFFYDSVILAEFVCDGCLQSHYIPTMMLTKEAEPQFPKNFDEVEQMILKSHPAFNRRHTAPIFEGKYKDDEVPLGYAQCGFYHLARLWKPWEDPNRYQEVVK